MASKTLASLIVRIGADVTGVTAGLSTLDKRVRKTKKQFSTVTDSTLRWQSALGLLAGAAGLAFATKKIFDLGAGIEETASKFRTVLGPSTEDAQRFLEEFASTAGLTITAGQELVATTAAMAQGMGFSQKASASFSEEVVRLAGDLTSFNDIPIEETSRAIQSALTGERESLKRLGIVILETDVQKKALDITSKTLAKDLTQQEKATATLALITQQAGVAMGDLERTMESPANRARRISVDFLNLRNDIATGLLPAMVVLLDELDATTGGFDSLGASVNRNAGVIAAWTLFAVESFKTVALAIVAPFRVAMNLATAFGNLVIAADELGKGNFKAAKEALAKMRGDFGDVKDSITNVIDGFDAMRIAAGDAWMVFAEGKTKAEDLAGALNKVATAAEAAAVASRLQVGAGMSAPKLPGGFGTPEAQEAFRARQEVLRGRAGQIKPMDVSRSVVQTIPGVTVSVGRRGAVGNAIGGVGDALGGAFKAARDALGQGMSQLWAKMGPAGLAIAVLFDLVKGAMEPLQPVIDALREPLRIIGTLIGQNLAPVLKLLVPIVNTVAKAFALSTLALGYLVQAIGKAVKWLSFGLVKGLEKTGKDMVANAKAALNAIGATNNATTATNAFTAALVAATVNIPRALPLAYLRQQAGMSNPPGTPGSGGSGNPPGKPGDHGGKTGEGDGDRFWITINGVLDPREAAQAVMSEIRRMKGRGESIELDRHYALRTV